MITRDNLVLNIYNRNWGIYMTDETREVIDAVKEMFSDLKSDIGRLEERLVKIEKTDIKRLEDRIIKIETTQENVTNKNIQLLW
ncbi:hypothetical protein IMSAG049_01664 [Clostridiales bacterium]|nr:hypothetical protein IMSAG049_01664 [Clostridiales bacterium]